jgi:transcriptional regulator
MNTRQLQEAIDKNMKIMVEKGTTLQHYHPHFYEKFSEATLKMVRVQAERAAMATTPRITLQDIK